MRELNAPDLVNGKQGRAFTKMNGNNEEMFYAKKLEAKAEKTKSEIKAIGKLAVGNKTTGIKYTGSMTIYYVTSKFRETIAEYKRTGKDIYFDMVIENDDPDSSAGQQTVLLIGVNLDSVILAKLDGDSDDPLDEDVDFTFEDFEILKAFNSF